MGVIPHVAVAGRVMTNPPGDTIVKGDDRLVVVSAGERHPS
jgi:Trk K+ transport system NAD-binding subunit